MLSWLDYFSSNMSPERKPNQYSFEEVVQLAKEVILRDGTHVPMLIAEGSIRGLAGHIPVMPETHEERIHFMRSAGYSTAQSGAIGFLKQVIFIGEGWMTVAEQGEAPKVRPAQDPQRKEVLIVAGLQVRDNTRELKLFEMQRDQEGTLVELGEITPKEDDHNQAENPLLDAFAEGFQMGLKQALN